MLPSMPSSPGMTMTERSGRTTRRSDTAIMVRCMRSMHSAIGRSCRTSLPRKTRISTLTPLAAGVRAMHASEAPSNILTWVERSAQVFHCRNEGLDVVIVVIEVKACPDIIVTVRSDDVTLHELLGQSAAVARRHGDGGAAALVLRGRNARPADLFQSLHATARESVVALFDGRSANRQQELEAGLGRVGIDHAGCAGFKSARVR